MYPGTHESSSSAGQLSVPSKHIRLRSAIRRDFRSRCSEERIGSHVPLRAIGFTKGLINRRSNAELEENQKVKCARSFLFYGAASLINLQLPLSLANLAAADTMECVVGLLIRQT